MSEDIFKNLAELKSLTGDASARIEVLIDSRCENKATHGAIAYVAVYCFTSNGFSHRHCGESFSDKNQLAEIHEYVIPKIMNKISKIVQNTDQNPE